MVLRHVTSHFNILNYYSEWRWNIVVNSWMLSWLFYNMFYEWNRDFVLSGLSTLLKKINMISTSARVADERADWFRRKEASPDYVLHSCLLVSRIFWEWPYQSIRINIVKGHHDGSLDRNRAYKSTIIWCIVMIIDILLSLSYGCDNAHVKDILCNICFLLYILTYFTLNVTYCWEFAF